MGIHVDVSHLSQDECSQIVGVIAKDIALRKFDQERIRLVLLRPLPGVPKSIQMWFDPAMWI